MGPGNAELGNVRLVDEVPGKVGLVDETTGNVGPGNAELGNVGLDDVSGNTDTTGQTENVWDMF